MSEEEWVDYKDEDIIIIDDLSKIPTKNIDGSLKLGMTVVLICSKGKLEIMIDGENVTVHTNQALVCTTNTIISDVLMSPDMHMFALGLSSHIMDLKKFNDKNLWKYAEYINRKHVMTLTNDDFNTLNNYYEMTRMSINKKNKPFLNKIRYHLQQAFIYELFGIADHNLPRQEEDDDSDIKQRDLIFKKFIIELIACEGKIHQVSEFSEKLHITPKYLSIAVKKASGKTALQWIHETVTKEIEQQLIYSDRSIKEIASGLNFNNMSFFGKYVKMHLGMSPKRFRAIKSKE